MPSLHAGAAALKARKMIGIQVGAVSFVDEGVEKVLDEFEDQASDNTLFIATFTYGRGIAGRQVPGQRRILVTTMCSKRSCPRQRNAV
jgi:hypothetical protein